MTARDLRWRIGGFALTGGSCVAALALDARPVTLPLFLLALLGLPLMIHGKRVAQLFRAERRGHCHTAEAVHAARVRRQGRR
ncbi:hypothetical protein SAMN06297144_3411 [Sphingomonas guangdongensis]|uniref:Uncharacterized protein n=1 Tax=Sphingomonas guangdongensis TaxID=1141890 RepID=A0A285R2D5_9SPHN|nr:hypothetical protein [Sphingomonas guangdongensis]SOB88263.1 hypothetical protein SAMN06297144_3411 [Sphingomonas guangdongensis]